MPVTSLLCFVFSVFNLLLDEGRHRTKADAHKINEAEERILGHFVEHATATRSERAFVIIVLCELLPCHVTSIMLDYLRAITSALSHRHLTNMIICKSPTNWYWCISTRASTRFRRKNLDGSDLITLFRESIKTWLLDSAKIDNGSDATKNETKCILYVSDHTLSEKNCDSSTSPKFNDISSTNFRKHALEVKNFIQLWNSPSSTMWKKVCVTMR